MLEALIWYCLRRNNPAEIRKLLRLASEQLVPKTGEKPQPTWQRISARLQWLRVWHFSKDHGDKIADPHFLIASLLDTARLNLDVREIAFVRFIQGYWDYYHEAYDGRTDTSGNESSTISRIG